MAPSRAQDSAFCLVGCRTYQGKAVVVASWLCCSVVGNFRTICCRGRTKPTKAKVMMGRGTACPTGKMACDQDTYDIGNFVMGGIYSEKLVRGGRWGIWCLGRGWVVRGVVVPALTVCGRVCVGGGRDAHCDD